MVCSLCCLGTPLSTLTSVLPLFISSFLVGCARVTTPWSCIACAVVSVVVSCCSYNHFDHITLIHRICSRCRSFYIAPCTRLLKESKRQLQLPYETSEEDEDESSPDIIAAAAVAAAMGTPPLPPPGTPPLIYGRGVPLHPPGAPVGDPLGLNPFGPLPADATAAGAITATAAAAGSSAAAAPSGTADVQQQQYFGVSSTSSMDGSCSVGGQWPAVEPSSSGGGRSGCPVYVMLPLDTVWVVERDNQKVSCIWPLKQVYALEGNVALWCVSVSVGVQQVLQQYQAIQLGLVPAHAATLVTCPAAAACRAATSRWGVFTLRCVLIRC